MAKRVLEVQLLGDHKSLSKAFGSANRDASKFGKQMSGINARVGRSFSNAMGSMVKFAAATTVLAATATGINKIVSATVEFDKGMRNVNSIAQLSEKRLGRLQKQVLKLAGKTAQAPQSLADGLYDLVSSGFDADESMQILASSAKAATAGLTDTGTSTKAVAAVLNAYKRPAKDAGKVSDVLFRTVDRGVISFEDLSSNIGDVLPFAASLKVGLGEVGGSIATLTKQGIGPEETMTRIKGAMVAFIKPSVDMQKAIEKTGAQSGEALIKQKGFQGAIESVRGATDGSKKSLAALFPDVRGLSAALALTGGNAKGAKKDLEGFKDATGATDKALEQQSKSISYRWDKIKSVISDVAIRAGSVLIPAFGDALDAVLGFASDVGDALGDLKDRFKELTDDGNSPLSAIGTMIADGVESVDWRSVGDKVKKGLKGALSGISGFVGEVDWKAVGDKMAAGLSTAMDFTGTLPTAIASGIKAAISQINGRDLLSGMLRVVSEAINALFSPSFWKENFAAIFAIVTIAIPFAKILKIPGASTLFKFISKPFFKAVEMTGKGLLSLFTKVAGKAIDGVIMGLSNSFPRVANVLLKLVSLSGRSFTSLPQKLGNIAKRAVQAVVARIAGAAENVGEAAGNLAGRAIKALGKGIGRFSTAGAKWVGRLIKGIASKLGAVGVVMVAIGTGAVNALKDLPSQFIEIGKDVMRGFLAGIKSMGDEITGAIGDVADSVYDETIGRLGIGSPSKKFRWIGKMVGEGLKEGLAASAAGTVKAANVGLLYPLDAAIAKLEARKEALQARWDAFDTKMQRAGLVRDITNSGAGGGGSLTGTGTGGGLQWAKRMVGHFAESSGSNEGPELDKLQKEFGHHAAAWCAMFATKAIVKAGGSKGLLTAAVQDVRNWATAGTNGLQKGMKKTPKAGDLMLFGNDHIAVVEKIVKGIVHTIEGNANGSGGVVRRTHKVGEGDYARPTFGNATGGGANVKTKSKLSVQQVRALAYQAGFRGVALDTMVAIVSAESGRKVRATNKNSDGSTDRGLAQINSVHGKLSTLNPVKNLKSAFKIFQGAGKSFKDWATFTSGKFKDFMGNVGSGKGSGLGGIGGGGLKDAINALKGFNTEAKRAKALAKIDLKIKGLEQLKAFRGALKEIRQSIKDVTDSAVTAWREIREGQIETGRTAAHTAVDNSPEALRLAGMDAEDIAEEVTGTRTELTDAVTDADAEVVTAKAQMEQEGSAEYKAIWKKAYDEAVKNAEQARKNLAKFEREQVKEGLRLHIENEHKKVDDAADVQIAGLGAEESAFRASLDVRLGDLNKSLAKQKISYAKWAKEVSEILAPLGLSIETSPEQEAAIGAGPGGGSGQRNYGGHSLAWWQNPNNARKNGKWDWPGDGHGFVHSRAFKESDWRGSGPPGKALGGPVRAGMPYIVGERGQELFVPEQNGRIVPNNRLGAGGRSSGGGNVIFNGPVSIGSQRAAQALANRLSYKLAFS